MLSLENQIKVLTGRLDREQQRHAQDDSSLLEIRRDLQLKESVLVDLEKRLSQVRLFLNMGASQISNRVVVEPPLVPGLRNGNCALSLELRALLAVCFSELPSPVFGNLLTIGCKATPMFSNISAFRWLGVFPMRNRRRCERRSTPGPYTSG